MNIVVCVKHAIDEGELKADAGGKPIFPDAQARMSTFDKNAIEEAVRIKEAKGGSITVLSLGSGDWKKTIKEALAMGCDKGLALSSEQHFDTLGTSFYLARALKSKAAPFDLVICSEGASDTYSGLIGPMLGEWLQLPFVGYARKIEVDANSRTVRCESALEETVEVLEAGLPAVISVVSEINSPRYPTLLQIMQASKKPIEEITLQSLTEGVGSAGPPGARSRVMEMTVQPVHRKRVVFEGVPDEVAAKLVDALNTEGVLQ